MHRSFESWSEDFAFSEELAALEQQLSLMALDDVLPNPLGKSLPHHQPVEHRTEPSSGYSPRYNDAKGNQVPSSPPLSGHPSETPRQQTFSSSPSQTSSPPLNLDRFVNLIVNNVLDKLSQEAVMDRFLKARELRKDNQLLASQVKYLLTDRKNLETEVAQCKQMLDRYKQVVGNIYLKLD